MSSKLSTKSRAEWPCSRGRKRLMAYFKDQDRLWKKIIEFGDFKPE